MRFDEGDTGVSATITCRGSSHAAARNPRFVVVVVVIVRFIFPLVVVGAIVASSSSGLDRSSQRITI
jgi:hypothetical protein